jgi:hypothetical protein
MTASLVDRSAAADCARLRALPHRAVQGVSACFFARSRTTTAGGRPIPPPAVTLAASDAVPTAPTCLRAAGKAAWNDLWTVGQAWLSPEADRVLMSMLAKRIDEQRTLERLIDRADPYSDRILSLRRALRALDEQITKLLAELGFTPSARSRLGVAEVKRRTPSEMDELMVRRDARRTS